MNIIKRFKNTKATKTTALVTSFLLLFNLMVSTTSQALVINSEPLNKNVYFKDKNTNIRFYTSEITDVDGKIVYCLSAEKNAPEGQDLTKKDTLNEVAYTILKNGYPNKNFTGDKVKDRIITQTALWASIENGVVDINNLVAIDNGVESESLLNYVKTLYNESVKNIEKPSGEIKFSTNNLTAILENDKYVTPYFQINTSGNVCNGGTVKIEKLSEILPIDIIIQSEDGEILDEIPVYTPVRIVIPKTTEKNTISLKATGTIDIKQAVGFEFKADDNIQDIAKYDWFPMEVETKNELIINWDDSKPITGGVTLTKVSDEDDKLTLSGAVFELYSGETLLNEYKTDENGKIEILNLDLNKYYFKEIKAPEGYVLNADVKYEFEIKDGNEIVEVKVTNKATKGEVDFSKTDMVTGELVDGAKIEILGLDEANKDVKIEFVSSKEGNRIKLPLGKYQFKETLAPEGYVQTTEVGNFEIKSNGEVVKAELKNKPILGNVEILKVDAQDNKKVLEGAEFVIYDTNGNEISKGTTNTEGKLEFKDLRYGKYVIKEIKAPTGYQLDNKNIEVEILEDGKTLTYEVKNQVNKLIQTGGMLSNTTLIGAGAILIGVGSYFIFKKKNKDEKNEE